MLAWMHGILEGCKAVSCDEALQTIADVGGMLSSVCQTGHGNILLRQEGRAAQVSLVLTASVSALRLSWRGDTLSTSALQSLLQAVTSIARVCSREVACMAAAVPRGDLEWFVECAARVADTTPLVGEQLAILLALHVRALEQAAAAQKRRITLDATEGSFIAMLLRLVRSDGRDGRQLTSVLALMAEVAVALNISAAQGHALAAQLSSFYPVLLEQEMEPTRSLQLRLTNLACLLLCQVRERNSV